MPFKDPERKRAFQREWVRRNAERHREQSREGVKRWRKRHPESHNAYRRAYHAANAARINARLAAWRRAHPDVALASHHNRRARETAGGSFRGREWRALVAAFGGRCGYCGERCRLEPDHRVPLARGGLNAISNIIPACGSCNRRKGALTEEEFRRRIARERR